MNNNLLLKDSSSYSLYGRSISILFQGHLNIVEFLLLQGESVHTKDSKGHTPLYYSLNSNSVSVVSLLINDGAHFNINEIEDVNDKLFKACYDGDIDMIKLLMLCNVDFNVCNVDGRSVVHMVII